MPSFRSDGITAGWVWWGTFAASFGASCIVLMVVAPIAWPAACGEDTAYPSSGLCLLIALPFAILVASVITWVFARLRRPPVEPRQTPALPAKPDGAPPPEAAGSAADVIPVIAVFEYDGYEHAQVAVLEAQATV